LLRVTEGVREKDRVTDCVMVREVEGVTEGVRWAVRVLAAEVVGGAETACTEDAVGVAVAVPDEVLVPGRFVEDHVRVTELVAVETRT